MLVITAIGWVASMTTEPCQLVSLQMQGDTGLPQAMPWLYCTDLNGPSPVTLSVQVSLPASAVPSIDW